MSALFTTERLLLDALRPEDAPALFAYRSDPSVTLFQGFSPERLEDAEAFIASGQGRAFGTPEAWCQLAIRERAGGALVGDLGARIHGHEASQAEVGFTIAPSHQRRGLATEAVTGLFGHLFEVLGVRRVVASVDPDNAASRALLGRLGMRQEAHFVESYWFRDRWVDDVVYAMLRDEWRSR